MTKIDYKLSFTNEEKNKFCNLLQCEISELKDILNMTNKIINESESLYEIEMKILQQGYNVREATLIGVLCGEKLGFFQAQKEMEDDIKQKLFDAFNNRGPR